MFEYFNCVCGCKDFEILNLGNMKFKFYCKKCGREYYPLKNVKKI